jgi:predicted metal-binding membrane protein
VDSRRVFLGILAIVFVASAAMTIAWCASIPAMGAMDTASGWPASMMWMRMPGQSWSGAAAGFVGMWVVMMVAMMLPSLTPTLLCYGESLGDSSGGRVGWLTGLVGVGYFAVWAGLGAFVFSLGRVAAAIAVTEPAQARGMPIVVGAVLLTAGVLQHTRWKARRLAVCRDAWVRHLTPHGGAGAALHHGLKLGLACAQSCAGLTAIMLALGVMDLRVMGVVAVAITGERLAPNGIRVARAVGGVAVAAGLLAIARAAGLG